MESDPPFSPAKVSRHITQIAVRVAGPPAGQGTGVGKRNSSFHEKNEGVFRTDSEIFPCFREETPPMEYCPKFGMPPVVLLFL
jgi:hypothetical protein